MSITAAPAPMTGAALISTMRGITMTTYTSTTLPAGTALMNRRVRITAAFPSLSDEERGLIEGVTGTCMWEQPDADGDIFVQFDEPLPHNGRSTSYAREWEFLDGPEALTSSEGVLPKTANELRLERLVEAIYEAAGDHGWQHLLVPLFEAADVPLRPAVRTLRIVGQRVISLTDHEAANQALARLRSETTIPEGSSVRVQRVIAEVESIVPWPLPGATTCECADLNNALRSGDTDYSSVPDEVLIQAGRLIAVGGVNAAAMRVWLTQQHRANSTYGGHVSCTYCR